MGWLLRPPARAYLVTARLRFALPGAQRMTVGRGVYEIRARDDSGAFRVMYIATFPESIYVLHAFQKKTQKTSKSDLELVQSRLRELLKSRK
jgi:phage-related protein